MRHRKWLAPLLLFPLTAIAQGLPTNAQPGECYARTYLPPQFREEPVQVLVSEATERIEVIPAEYEWVEERVLVRPETERIVEVVPAQYRTVEEQVMVKPPSERIETVPARYRTEEVRELVKPATTVWRPGRGLIERVDNVTGEILCLVEEPAEYRTVKRQVLVEPETTRRVTIPAEYKTVRRQELVKPAEVRREVVPAQYETVRVRRQVRPAEERRVPVPARYETVMRRVQVSEAQLSWQPVICETNATPDIVMEIQRALQRAGFSPGPIDGKLGQRTYDAATRFQEANGLATGGITFETLQRLGVTVRTRGSSI